MYKCTHTHTHTLGSSPMAAQYNGCLLSSSIELELLKGTLTEVAEIQQSFNSGVKHVPFANRKCVKSRQRSETFIPTVVWSPTFNMQQITGSYCHWLLESWVTSLFCGKLSSSWILCMSLLVSSAFDLTFRSPISSSVNCRRAVLRM